MTVCLSFLQTEMDQEQQMDMADTNQPQTDSSIMINKVMTDVQQQQNKKLSSEMRQETTLLGSHQHGTVS